jgi:hypothetical protein
VLCCALTLINNIIHVFMLKDEIGAQNKKGKKLWTSPKVMEKRLYINLKVYIVVTNGNCWT